MKDFLEEGLTALIILGSLSAIAAIIWGIGYLVVLLLR